MTEPAVPGPEGAKPSGLLLSRDLIFTSKITGTARSLGYRVVVAGDVALASAMIERDRPRAVFVDLTAGDLVGVPALLAYRQAAGPDATFVAFGPHVDVSALENARSTGCQVVLPRSKFSAELPEVIRAAFGGPGDPGG
ncbi:MAG: response regulator [Isosphaeraceae bacterium]